VVAGVLVEGVAEVDRQRLLDVVQEEAVDFVLLP
jgi:hypothetical protein